MTTLDSQSQASLSEIRSEKAQAVLQGALQVFMVQGYAAASMDRIAAAAGVSKSTLYSHFQDKEGLFLALIQELTFSSRQGVFALLSQSDVEAAPEQVLRQIATLMLNNFDKNKPLLTLMRLVIGESERFPQVAKTFVQEIKKPLLEQLSLYLSSQTQLNLPDPIVAARIFAGSLVHYLITQNVLHGDEVMPIERDRMIDGLIQLITARKQSDQSD
ncbi:TetR/AcrR family transcriptional regulator [Oscillatoria sp. CS-180]|uniref:TetR/AcrR family transcriptional regulator n=1 Tax=Oscillatoria sp. CS-180 TaxID=3021720 RepID=UPI0023304640|nr:TetR/AcrR family transcriptional regulator [Oscillatoria sp. CS-180]MDB9529883.1 TetR/AcrR family transcriptional regulator [Oscillatoria sp. CS-180]